MKTVAALLASTIVAGSVLAQTRTVEVSRSEGVDTISGGVGVSVRGIEFDATVSADSENNWKATASNTSTLWGFSMSPYATYSWGNGAGDVVGWGDDNEWGSVAVGAEAAYAPGIIGNEYVFLGAEYGVGEAFDFAGGGYGVGYDVTLAENISLNGRMTWAYDSQFEIAEPVVGISLGFSF